MTGWSIDGKLEDEDLLGWMLLCLLSEWYVVSTGSEKNSKHLFSLQEEVQVTAAMVMAMARATSDNGANSFL